MPYLVADGGDVAVVNSFVDITAQQRSTQALRESEQRFRSLFEQSNDAILVHDRAGTVVDANARACELLGYGREELLRRSVYDLQTNLSEADLQAAFTRLSTRRGIRGETRLRRADGRSIDVEVSARLLRDDAPQIIAILRDVSARKQVEARDRGRTAYLTALHETALSLLQRLDLDELLEALITRACALLDAAAGYVTLTDADGEGVRLVAGTGMFRERVGRRRSRGEGFAGQVIARCEPLAVADYASWPERIEDRELDPLHALAGAPLFAGSAAIGVLCVARHEPERAFTPEQLEALAHFAHLASVALENARLFEQAQRQLAERTRAEAELRRQHGYLAALHETSLGLLNRLEPRDLLPAIVSRAAALLGAEHGFVNLLTPDGSAMAGTGGVGLFQDKTDTFRRGEGLVGTVWQRGETVVVDDYQAWSGRAEPGYRDVVRAAVGVPLRSGGEVVGVIGLARLEAGHHFLAEEVELLQRFAQLAAIAYDNARLFAARRRRRGRRSPRPAPPCPCAGRRCGETVPAKVGHRPRRAHPSALDVPSSRPPPAHRPGSRGRPRLRRAGGHRRHGRSRRRPWSRTRRAAALLMLPAARPGSPPPACDARARRPGARARSRGRPASRSDRESAARPAERRGRPCSRQRAHRSPGYRRAAGRRPRWRRSPRSRR